MSMVNSCLPEFSDFTRVFYSGKCFMQWAPLIFANPLRLLSNGTMATYANSRLPWLRRHSFSEPDFDPFVDLQPVLWDASAFRDRLRTFDFNDVLSDDATLFEMLRELKVFGLTFVRDAPRKEGTDSPGLLIESATSAQPITGNATVTPSRKIIWPVSRGGSRIFMGGGANNNYVRSHIITSAKHEVPYIEPGSRARLRASEALEGFLMHPHSHFAKILMRFFFYGTSRNLDPWLYNVIYPVFYYPSFYQIPRDKGTIQRENMNHWYTKSTKRASGPLLIVIDNTKVSKM